MRSDNLEEIKEFPNDNEQEIKYHSKPFSKHQR